MQKDSLLHQDRVQTQRIVFFFSQESSVVEDVTFSDERILKEREKSRRVSRGGILVDMAGKKMRKEGLGTGGLLHVSGRQEYRETETAGLLLICSKKN